MNAEIAGNLIAKFIDKRFPNEKEEVWEILRLGINRAWQEGKWLGMTAEFTVPIMRDHDGQDYIISPRSHPILLAVNGLSQGLTIRDQYFMFHRNGYGDVRNSAKCKWNQDVYDIGSSPYIDKNNIIPQGVRIGVRSVGPSGPNERVWIGGGHSDGRKIYSYQKQTYGSACGCKVDEDKIDTVQGVEIAVSNNFNYISNICFSSISSITKTPTRSPIEVIAMLQDGTAFPIARMDPNHRFSQYRKYLVPSDLCGKRSLHALFKIGKQELITSNTDELIISNEEALIGLAKGINEMYYKNQQEAGASFIVQAITVLEKEKREEESPSEYPIQVQGTYEGDLPNILKNFS